MLSPSEIQIAQARFMLFDHPQAKLTEYIERNAATLEADCATFFDFENFRETYVALLEDLDFRYGINPHGWSLPETWMYDALCASLIAATGCTPQVAYDSLKGIL